MNPPARRLSIWFLDPQPSRPVRINHTLAGRSRPAKAVIKLPPQPAQPGPSNARANNTA